MGLPIMKRTPTYTLTVPEMSGGMNLRDGLTLVSDNQLTDCKNVWFKDGMLRTRPRVRSSDLTDVVSTSEGFDYDHAQKLNINISSDNVAVINGQRYILQATAIEFYDEEQSLNTLKVMLKYVCESDINSEVYVGEFSIEHSFGEAGSILVFQHNGDVYCFIADNPDATVVRIKRESEGRYAEHEKLTEEDMTVPLIATNGKPDSVSTDFTGEMINGHNLLTRYYTAQYSTVDLSAESNRMRYPLIHPVQYATANGWMPYDYAVGKKVTVTYTTIEGKEYTHEVTLNEWGAGDEQTAGEDGYRLSVNHSGFNLWDDSTGDYPYVTPDDYVSNNLTVTAPGPFDEAYVKKAVNMTRATWFGGASYGLYGGSRLFLGGNTQDSEQALIIWSDLNDPLYFSENNYTYVGDKAQAVTAFGKQADALVIFKERETYQTQYVANETPTAEEIINQSVIDLSAQTAYFPVTLVHGYIGCDCPDTVKLCRNRLMWANSDGKVYTLQSQNQYNERAIFEVSEMVERRLKAETDLKKAHAVDYDGHYILQVGSHLYVMDYNSYGSIYVSSHAKNEDANIKIPWYYWELPITPDAMLAVSDSLIMTVCVIDGTAERVSACVKNFYFDDSVNTDIIAVPRYDNGWVADTEKLNVSVLIQTKLYDFGAPARLKSVNIVNFSFGYNDGAPIKVEFISERSISDEHSITVSGAEAKSYEPQYIHPCRLFPYTKGTVMFGARITCDGMLSIASMSLQYKALGGAK